MMDKHEDEATNEAPSTSEKPAPEIPTNPYLKSRDGQNFELIHVKNIEHRIVYADGCIATGPVGMNQNFCLSFYQDIMHIVLEKMEVVPTSQHLLIKRKDDNGVVSHPLRNDSVTVMVSERGLRELKSNVDTLIEIIENATSKR